MIRKNFALFVVLMLTFSLHAQEMVGTADSLFKSLAQYPEKDTNRVWTYIRLTSALFQSNPDSALAFADKALETSEAIGWSKGRTLALKVKGGVYYVKSDYLKALDFWQKSIDADSGKSLLHEASIRNNMGVVYREFKDYPKARENYKAYARVAESLNIKEQMSMAYANLGTIYILENKYDSAESILKRSLALAKDTGNTRIQSSVLASLGSMYKETGRYAEGIPVLEQAITLADKESNLYIKAPALNTLAHIYRGMGKLPAAEKAATASLEISQTLQNLVWQYEAWEELSRIHKAQGRPAEALDAYTRFVALRDSALSNDKKTELTRMEMRVEAAANEARMKAEHEAEVNSQKMRTYATGAGGILLVLGGLTGFGLYRKRKVAQQKQQEAELKAELLDIEMKALRAQMNPHFIFNSLNSISDFIARHDTESARKYLGKFAQLMRMTLEHSEKKEITLAEELHALDLYLKLEALRLNHKLSYEIQVDPSLNPEDTLIPPLILQPFVENSIWHGIAPKPEGGHVRIRTERDGRVIRCMVEDNGIGRSASATGKADEKTRKSMGSSITRTRIDLLNRLQDTAAALSYQDLQPGLKTTIQLPFISNFQA